jgi:hypothetical protein
MTDISIQDARAKVREQVRQTDRQGKITIDIDVW